MGKQLRNDLKRGDAAGMPRVEWAPIATIRPNPKNARTHSRKQIRQIAASIRKFGFLNPLHCRRRQHHPCWTWAP